MIVAPLLSLSEGSTTPAPSKSSPRGTGSCLPPARKQANRAHETRAARLGERPLTRTAAHGSRINHSRWFASTRLDAAWSLGAGRGAREQPAGDDVDERNEHRQPKAGSTDATRPPSQRSSPTAPPPLTTVFVHPTGFVRDRARL